MGRVRRSLRRRARCMNEVGRQRGGGPHGHAGPQARRSRADRTQHGPSARANHRQQNALSERSVKCESCIPTRRVPLLQKALPLQAVFPGRARRPPASAPPPLQPCLCWAHPPRLLLATGGSVSAHAAQ